MRHLTLKNWLLATRPWSFPASAIPAVIAFSYVFYLSQTAVQVSVNWIYGFLAVLGAVLFQAAGNLISDYFDYKYHVDNKESFGSSRMLVDKVFTPKEIFVFGMIILAVSTGIGLYMLSTVPISLLWIEFIGVLSTYFYYLLKYRALGDFIIFIIYGLLIALGTSLVMTNILCWKILLISAASGCLIVNILHANNMRDIKHDSAADIKTLPMILGIRNAIRQYIVLGSCAYLIITLCVALAYLHWICLVVWVTLPLFLKNIQAIQKAEIERPERIRDMDTRSAQLVTGFGVLLVIANIAAGIMV